MVKKKIIHFPFCNGPCHTCTKENMEPDKFDIDRFLEVVQDAEVVQIGDECFEPLALPVFVRSMLLADKLVRLRKEVIIRTNGTVDLGPAAFMPGVRYEIHLYGPSRAFVNKYVDGAFAHLHEKDKVIFHVCDEKDLRFMKSKTKFLQEHLKCQAKIRRCSCHETNRRTT